MGQDQFLIINKSNLQDLAEALAPLIKSALIKSDDDPYLTPSELAKRVPVLSEHSIKTQIRNKCYGKRIGAKGRLAARISEVKKHNRL
jgi:hypothetical protein